MSRRTDIPTPVLIQINQNNIALQPTEVRLARIDEYLQARSLSPKTQTAYRQDLQHFLNWSDQAWAVVTPRQVAQFKTYLLRTENGKQVLSNATVRRVLGTLKSFYG